jgi:hypothetical protein
VTDVDTTQDSLPSIESLDDFADLIARADQLYLRWSRGPAVDEGRASCDDLTGAPLDGLSATPLAVEEWWGDRPLRLWAARRIYDYRHLPEIRGPVRPWVLRGREIGRGPDNEPLVECLEPLAWIAAEVVHDATRLVEAQRSQWGPLRRQP